MTNPNKNAGTTYERIVAAYLSVVLERPVERRALSGALDKGDLIIDGANVTLECKTGAQIRSTRPEKFVEEARREADNAGAEIYGAVLKRHGLGVAKSSVATTWGVWSKMLGLVIHQDVRDEFIVVTLALFAYTLRGHLGTKREAA